MKWSSCPVFTFTDSFGVGWIAADSSSHEVITKTDSSIASVQYYTVEGQNAGLYRDIAMDILYLHGFTGKRLPILAESRKTEFKRCFMGLH